MSIEIEDGKGSGRRAEVDKENKLSVSSTGHSESSEVSRERGATYLWTSSYSAGTGNEVIYIKNTSTTQNLIIDKATVNSVLTGLFELNVAAGTAGGTTITGTNANLTSGNAASASSYGNASVTGITPGIRIDMARIPANGRATMELNDILILGLNDAVSITYTGSTGIVDIIVTGYGIVMDGTGTKSKARVTTRGELVVASIAFSEPYFNAMTVDDQVYNFTEPSAGMQFVITDIVAGADRNVGATGVDISIYESTTATGTSSKDILTLSLSKQSNTNLIGLNLITSTGTYLNATMDDNNVNLTILGYYVEVGA